LGGGQWVASSRAGFDFTFASTAVDICPLNPLFGPSSVVDMRLCGASN